MSADGRWAIITGASSGIGKALAFEFASGGFDLVLTGRNEAELTKVAAECASRFRIATDVIPADLSGIASIEALAAGLAAKPRRYEVLVNNAGFGVYGKFEASDIQQELAMLNVQLAAALTLTKAVLPGMTSRRSGRILNVASVYSYAPVPLQSVYAACKAFLFSFSASLRNELSGSGITVSVFCPGVTQTEFRSRAGIAERSRRSGITAEAAARSAYAGTMQGRPVIVTGLVNRLFVTFTKLFPATLTANLIRFINTKRGQSSS